MKDQNKTKRQLLTEVAELRQCVSELEAQVTRHGQAEQDLQRLKDFHAGIVHNIAEGVAVEDAAGYFSFVNPAAATLLGYAPEELVGRHWTSIIPLDQQPIVQAADDRRAHGQANRYEVEVIRKDGRRVSMLVSASSLFATDGRFLESQAVFTDITERKQAEAALRESEARYRRLFEDAVLGIFQSTLDGRVIAVNPAFARMFGYGSPEEVASTVQNVATDIFADPQRRAEIARLMMERPDLKGFENLYRRKDGSLFTGTLHVWPVRDAEGQLLHLEGFIEDITERKRAEEKLRESLDFLNALVEAAPLPIFSLDLEGRVRSIWNPAAERLLGWRKEKVMGQFLPTVPVDKHEEFARFRGMIRQGKVLDGVESRQMRSDGSPIDYSIYAVPMHDAAGHIIGNVVVLLDLTERKQAEEALRKSEELNGTLIQNSPIGVSVRSRTGRLLSCNPAWKRIWAMPDEAVAADLTRERSRLEFDEKDTYLKPHLAELRRIYENGGVLYLPELRTMQARSGAAQWIAQYFYAIQDDLGKVDRVVILTEDITERKRAEDALRRYADEQATLYKTSLRLNAQLETSELLHLILDQAVALLGAEAGCLCLYDPQPDELTVSVGVSFMSEFVGVTLRPGEGLAGQAFASRRPQFVDDHCARPGPAAVYEGDARLRAALAVPLSGRKGVLGVLDIEGGERKLTFDEHDVELAELFAAQAGVALENARLHAETRRRAREFAALNMATQALTSTLNLKSVLELMITEARALVDAEGASVVLLSDAELVFAAAAGPGAEELVGVRMPITAGIAGWVVREGRAVRVNDTRSDPRFYAGIDKMTSLTTRSVLAVPLRIKGAIAGIVEAINKASLPGATGQDGLFNEHDLEMLQMMADSAAIAIENARLYQVEQEQLQRLQESQAQLIQSAKMAALGRLVASITHEINNPLQAIQNSLTLAQEEMESGPRPEKMARYLGMAETEIERLANIVRRLRDFYRPTRQERQLTDVRVVLEGVLELTGKQLQHSHITVEREDLAGVGLPLIWAKPDHLKQVFLNLVLNAIDAMSAPAAGEARGGTLCVRMALDTLPRDGPPRPAVRIEFSDTGEGIPPEIMSHLFEPFITTKPDGTGLGLSISYGIIEAHNGQITATSQVGEGTTFTILLPVEESPIIG